MKKLLSLLSILIISGTAVPTAIAASPYREQKQIQKDNLKINKYNNYYIEKFTNIESDIRNIAIDSKNNIYFSGSETNDVNYYVYTLKQKGNTANKITDLNENRVTSLIEKNNDIYISTSGGHIYVLKRGEIIPKQINFKQNFSSYDDINTIDINKKGDIYFGIYQNGSSNNGAYILKQGANESQKFTKIQGWNVNSIVVDSKDNVYFATELYTYMLKNNLEFTKIYRIENAINILIDNKNNVYFINNYDDFYLLSKNKIKSLTPTAVKKIYSLNSINIWNNFIDKISNRIYFATSNSQYTFKKYEKIWKKY